MIDGIVSTLLLDALKTLAHTFKDTERRTALASQVADEFPKYPALEAQLAGWLGDGGIEQLLDALAVPSATDLPAGTIEAFAQHSGFHDPSSPTAAAEIVKRTAQLLVSNAALTDSEEARLYHRRQDAQLGEHTEMLRSMREQVAQIDRHILGVAPFLSDAGKAEAVAESNIESAKALLKKARPNAALAMLDAAIDGDTKTLKDYHGRHTRLRGLALLMRGDYGEAAECFEEVHGADSDDAGVLAHLALARLLAGRLAPAMEAVARIDPEVTLPDALAAQVLVASRYGDFQSVEVIASRIQHVDDAEAVVLALAQHEIWHGKPRQAIPRLESLLSTGDRNPWVKRLLAQSLLLAGRDVASGGPSDPKPEDGGRGRLDRARTLLDEAIGQLEETELVHERSDALFSRAQVKRQLGQWRSAVDDCLASIALDASRSSRFLLGAIYLEAGDFQSAIAQLTEVLKQEDTADARLMLARARLEVDPGRTDELLVPDENWTEEDRVEAACLGMIAQTKAGDREAAQDLEESLLAQHPESVRVLQSIAHRQLILGRRELGIDRLLEARAIATGAEWRVVSVNLANLLWSSGRFAEAADVYAALPDEDLDDALRVRQLIALFNAGAYGEALDLARRVEPSLPSSPELWAIKSRLLEICGDLEEALRSCMRAAELNPQGAPTEHLRAASLALRLDRREAAVASLQEVSPQDLGANWELLMQAGQLAVQLELTSAIDFFYWARSAGYREPAAHLAYLEHCHSRSSEHVRLQDPAEVAADSSVLLSVDGKEMAFTITAASGREEVALGKVLFAEDDLAKRLLGKSVGDRVKLGAKASHNVEGHIIHIMTKYSAALRDTESKFDELFPGHPGFERVSIDDGDVSPVLAVVDARAEHVAGAMRLLQGGEATLPLVADLVGLGETELWYAVANGTEHRLPVSSGSLRELREGMKEVGGEKPLVVGLATLLALDAMGLLLGGILPDGALVARDVVDELRRAKRAIRERASAGSIVRVGARYAWAEPAPEAGEVLARRVEGVVAFVESELDVRPVRRLLEFKAGDAVVLRRALGTDLGTGLLASEENAVALVDLLRSRQHVHALCACSVSWAIPLVAAANQDGRLSDGDYDKAICKAACLNFQQLNIRPSTLLCALRERDLGRDAAAWRLLDVLAGGGASLESAVRIAAAVLRALALDRTTFQRKQLLERLVIAAVLKRRPGLTAKRSLVSAVQEQFRLIPLHGREVVESIGAWARVAPKVEDIERTLWLP